jgi:hypothetical protein
MYLFQVVMLFTFYFHIGNPTMFTRRRLGRDCIIVGLTTTYAISAYHHLCCEFESRSGRGVQHIAESGVKHHQANKQLYLCNNIYMKAR